MKRLDKNKTLSPILVLSRSQKYVEELNAAQKDVLDYQAGVLACKLQVECDKVACRDLEIARLKRVVRMYRKHGI